MKPNFRLYRFVVEVLDEPNCSDEQLERELGEMLDSYFEAIDVQVELVAADDVIGIDSDLSIAET